MQIPLATDKNMKKKDLKRKGLNIPVSDDRSI